MNELLDFRYKEKGLDRLSNRKHSHTYHFEILHINSGSGSIIVDDHIFPIQKDTIVFINGINTHCSVPEDPESYVRTKLVISQSYLRSIAQITGFTEGIRDLFPDQGGVCIKLNPAQALLIDEEMREIREQLSAPSQKSRTAVTLATFRILLCAHENIHNHTAPIHNKMSDVLTYLNEHISKKITLDDLCETLHISKYYLCHTFKQTIGMTIFEYILIQRLSLAKKKLLDSDESISEISLSTGFSSFSYFSKAFKEYEGISPKEFRKKSAGLS